MPWGLFRKVIQAFIQAKVFINSLKDNMGTSPYEIVSTVRGHHIYRVVWSPYVGEMLLVGKMDEHALEVVRDDYIFGDLLHHISQISANIL